MTSENERAVLCFRTGRDAVVYVDRVAEKWGVDRSEVMRRLFRYAVQTMPELKEIK